MRSQKTVNSFVKGIDRDTSVNKYSSDNYYDAQNMRLITDDALSAGVMNNVPGNSLKIQFATGDVVLGTCSIRNNFNNTNKDSIVYFTYNTTSLESLIYLLEGDADAIDTSVTPINMNHIFSTVGTYKCGYIYKNSELNFNVNNLIKAEGRYESSTIRKVYWVDGLNPIRYMILDNVTQDMDVSLFDITPSATLGTPTAVVSNGGAYTSGVVQYSYQLYTKNGARTTFSPCSNLVYLTSSFNELESKNITGSELNVNTGCAVTVTLPALDSNYTRVRVVALHYTEINVNPTVNIVGEFEYDAGGTFTFTDNGYTNYGTIELSEFRILGQINYTADSLSSKNNIMFYANLKEDIWNPTWLDSNESTFFDCRAVRFRNYTDPSAGGTDTADKYLEYQGPQDLEGVVTRLTNYAFEVIVPNYPTAMGISSSRTVTGVTSVSGLQFQIWYRTTDDVIHYYYPDQNATVTITGIQYGSNSLSFTVSSSEQIFNPSNGTFSYIEDLKYQIYTTYSYTVVGTAVIEATVSDANLGDFTISGLLQNTADPVEWNQAGWDAFRYNHDAINNFNDLDNFGDASKAYKYQSNGSTLGAEGPNVKIEFVEEPLKIDTFGNTVDNVSVSPPYTNTPVESYKRSSQRDETYRIYVVFFNTKMQHSNPQWICDLKMPSVAEYNLVDFFPSVLVGTVANYLFPKITLRNLPVDSDLLGWQIFRCKRNDVDKSIKARGWASPLDGKDWNTPYLYSQQYSPYIGATTDIISSVIGDIIYPNIGDSIYSNILELISPDINFNNNISYSSGDKFKVDGRYKYVEYLDPDENTNDDLSKYYLKCISDTIPGATDALLTPINDIILAKVQEKTDAPITYTINGKAYIHELQTNSQGAYPLQTGNRGSTLIIGLSTDLIVESTPYYIMGSIARNAFNIQYNGITYEARSYNQVIPYSDFTLKTTATSNCHYGDTSITYFAYLRCMYPTIGNTSPRQEVIFVPTESTINCNYRLDNIQNHFVTPYNNTRSYKVYALEEKESMGITKWPDTYPSDIGDLYRYNKAYSSENSGMLIQCQPFDSINVEECDTKIIATDKKINNEYFDSWTNIKVNNYLELEGKYGSINNIFHFGNRLFAMQDKAVAILGVNDRSLIQDNNNIALTLGTGGVLERFDYLTTSSGIQESTDMLISNKAIYYLDRSDKIIYNITTEGDNPISEVGGIKSLLKSYSNITTVRTAFDPEYKELLFYISDGTIKNVISYSEYINAFISRYSFEPSLMYNINDHLYSIPTTSASVYRHNIGNYGSFYGTIYDSYVDMIINPNTTVVDKYDVLDLRADVINSNGEYITTDTLTSLVAGNSYQTDIIKTITFDESQQPSTYLSDTAKNLIRKWTMWLLPDDNSSTFYRLTDTYLRLKLVRKNTDSYKFVLHDVTTYYRPCKN